MIECGDCTACCHGWLMGSAYGNDFYPGKRCVFLNQNCTIYTNRPRACSNYQCAWSQGLFEHWLKPTESNVIVSVEVDPGGKQFLKVVEMGIPIRLDVLNYIDNWVRQNNTYYILIKGDKNEN
jgi:hypothetical protein